MGRAVDVSNLSASGVQHRDRCCDCQIFGYQSEWLFFAVFALAESLDRILVSSVARQVIPAKALYRDNKSLLELFRGLVNGRAIGHFLGRALNKIMRPTIRAGHRLGVKAPVCRIVILMPAECVEWPRLHGGVRTVVWERKNHTVSRAAVGAVVVRIGVSRIRGVVQFF